jgi:uncharacterized membrane protein
MSKFLSLLESHPWSNLIAQSTKSLASTNQINNQEVMEYSVTALIIFSLLGLLLKNGLKKRILEVKKSTKIGILSF